MRDAHAHLRKMNVTKGLDENAKIRAGIDCKYNTRLQAGRGKTPFQPATQVSSTLVEGNTGRNEIIAVFTGNKLCTKCSRRIQKGENTQHEGSCSANIAEDQTIGAEGLWAKKLMEQVLEDPETAVRIGYLTSDGDSHAADGISEAQKEQVENLIDTRHFAESIARSIEKLCFSKDAFPGCTAVDRSRMQKSLAHNVKRRCEAEYQAAYKRYNGNVCTIKNKLTYATDAMMSCYNGKCGKPCQKHSLVCDGKGRGAWQHDYLEDGMRPLSLSKEDMHNLRHCITLRLGKEGIDRTKFNTNTQSIEAAHRSYTSNNPQQVTMSRNFPARVHAAVHKLNHGIANSILKKLEYLKVPLRPQTRPCHALKRMQNCERLRALRQKSSALKMQRAEKRRRLHKLHSEKRARRKQEDIYKKGLLLAQTKSVKHDHLYTSRKEHFDHNYHLRSKVTYQ